MDKQSKIEDIIEDMRVYINKVEGESEEEKFRKSLDAGISLEEQNEFAVQWADVDENEKENEEKRPALESDIELI